MVEEAGSKGTRALSVRRDIWSRSGLPKNVQDFPETRSWKKAEGTGEGKRRGLAHRVTGDVEEKYHAPPSRDLDSQWDAAYARDRVQTTVAGAQRVARACQAWLMAYRTVVNTPAPGSTQAGHQRRITRQHGADVSGDSPSVDMLG